jgi:hypothetical protein
MVEPCEIKLIKQCLGEIRRLTSPAIRLAPFDKGYAELFQRHVGNLLSLLQPYSEANEVKSLREEYNRVMRQVQVFDQLPKPLFTFASDKNEGEKKKYIDLEILVKQIIDKFRYHSTDVISKVEKGELKPKKPAETEQNTTLFGKILEKVLYIFTRSFWDAVFDRYWHK